MPDPDDALAIANGAVTKEDLDKAPSGNPNDETRNPNQ
jgi:hypothetical protein